MQLKSCINMVGQVRKWYREKGKPWRTDDRNTKTVKSFLFTSWSADFGVLFTFHCLFRVGGALESSICIYDSDNKTKKMYKKLWADLQHGTLVSERLVARWVTVHAQYSTCTTIHIRSLYTFTEITLGKEPVPEELSLTISITHLLW